MANNSALISFFKDAFKSASRGGRFYYVGMGALGLVILFGLYAYSIQLREGLIVTGMNDIVTWGLYISNFTFLVGMAAAAVMLILPAYVLKDVDFGKAVLLAEGVAVAALVMCLAFVVADIANPIRTWHLIPKIGLFNWPDSMLSWDIIVLNGYLLINLVVPFYILFTHYRGRELNKKVYIPIMFLSILWAVSIHLVTAFLYAGIPARPFWNSSLLGPRFLASAFTSGPALMIILINVIRRVSGFEIKDQLVSKLALIVTVAAQVNLIMLGSELFKEFYTTTEHSMSAIYLFAGLEGHKSLVPWVWTSISINLLATLALSIHPIRRNMKALNALCFFLFIAVWIEKGMGLIVPGFIPSPIGEIVDYVPTWVEYAVTGGIWALGLFVLILLLKVALPIESGQKRFSHAKASH